MRIMGEGTIGAPHPRGSCSEAVQVRGGGEGRIEQRSNKRTRRGALLRGLAEHLRDDQTKPAIEHHV